MRSYGLSREAVVKDLLRTKGPPKSSPKPSGGFHSLAENLRHIMRAARCYGVDPRLVRAPAGMSETDPSGGGFLVQENYADELVGSLYEAAVIAPLCDRWPTGNPKATLKIPAIDETSRADGSRFGGAIAYWQSEGDTISPSFPRFRMLELSTKKLIAVCIGSAELYSDAPAFDVWIRRIFAAEMAFKVDLAIIAGSGAGQPKGILNSSALLTIAKATGQANGTILADNVEAMYAALPVQSRKTAVWLINEQVEPQLDRLNSGGDSATMYVPAGWHGSPFPLLKGLQVITAEQCSILGQIGDIILVDLTKYILLDGDMATELSAAVRFLDDQMVWRFVLRIDGQSMFASPVTPFRGTGSRSPYVTLAAR
jgi:HK97 family phage major capsid protein